MIGQYLSNNNENTAVSILPKKIASKPGLGRLGQEQQDSRFARQMPKAVFSSLKKNTVQTKDSPSH
jgi:hypothetical protein